MFLRTPNFLIMNIVDTESYDTLSSAVNSLTDEGYVDIFRANDNDIMALYSKKSYQPEDLHILRSYRFDCMTNPQDETVVFAIDAWDGTKGTLVMSYSAEHEQNLDLIRRIEYK